MLAVDRFRRPEVCTTLDSRYTPDAYRHSAWELALLYFNVSARRGCAALRALWVGRGPACGSVSREALLLRV